MKQRCIAKELKQGRFMLWSVYDTEHGSWPALVPGYGAVAQDHEKREDAEAEAEKLNAWYAGPGKILR